MIARMSDDIDRFLAAYDPEIQDLARRACALVRSVAPTADESLKTGWKVIWYGFGPGMPSQFAVIMPTRKHVGLGFAHGAELPDPSGRLEGEGKRMRHVKLRSVADVTDPEVVALVRAQVARMQAGGASGKPPPAEKKRARKKTAAKKTPAKKRGGKKPPPRRPLSRPRRSPRSSGRRAS